MKQTRFIPAETCGLQLREPQEGQQENRTIEGRPIVFGVRSVNLTPWSSTRKVYEVLEPGCISRELLQKSDVVLNLNHSNMVPDVLGRYRNTDRDTLSLELRGDGIDCRCELPNTSNANDALELIKRGDINGMSFAFEDDYEDTENGVSYERTNDVEDGDVPMASANLMTLKALIAKSDASTQLKPGNYTVEGGGEGGSEEG